MTNSDSLQGMPVHNFTVTREVNAGKQEPHFILSGEEVLAAYGTVRDKLYFTTYRLVIEDSTGATGREKVRVYMPYSAITGWSMETHGLMDVTTEMTIWSRMGTVNLKISRNIDVERLDRILASAVIN